MRLDVTDVLALAGVTWACFSAHHGAKNADSAGRLQPSYLLTHADYIIVTILVTSNRREGFKSWREVKKAGKDDGDGGQLNIRSEHGRSYWD